MAAVQWIVNMPWAATKSICLCVIDPWLAIELKVWRRGRPDPLSQGLQQLDNYLRGLSLPTGWLIIFDQHDNLPALSERTTSESATTPSGRVVTVIRA